MAVFECRTEVAVTPEVLFDFMTRPANIAAIAPPDSQMVIVEAPEVLAPGAQLVFKVSAMGVTQQLIHEIVSLTRPEGFREQMVKGPMSSWVHDYTIERLDNGHAALLNRIEFEPPGGMLGFILTAEKILERLEEGYAHRSEALKRALEG